MGLGHVLGVQARKAARVTLRRFDPQGLSRGKLRGIDMQMEASVCNIDFNGVTRFDQRQGATHG